MNDVASQLIDESIQEFFSHGSFVNSFSESLTVNSTSIDDLLYR